MSIKNSGYQFAWPNPQARRYRPSLGLTPPARVDLRAFVTPVENQGPLQSCTANAIAGAYEYLIKKHTGAHVDLSRLFIYYNARWRNDEQHEDCGSVIQYGMESLQNFGACDEKVWPYKTASVLEKPKQLSYTQAEKFRVLDMQKVEVDLDHWRTCLAEGYPIVFGCALFESFDDCNKHHGLVPMPDPQDVARGEHGRHAMLCVGYSDVDQVFIVRNSWGADWGERGYCYMPYNYLMSEKLNGGDCWMLRGEDHVPDPAAGWSDDDRPLLRGVDPSLINRWLPDAYDWIELVFFGREDDFHYSEEVSSEYVEFYESVESEVTFIEESETYLSFESEETEEESEEVDEEDEESEEEESEEEEEEESDEEEEEEEEDDEEEEGEDEEDAEEEDEEESDDEEEEEEESDDADDDSDDGDESDDDDSGDDDSGDDDSGDDDSGDDDSGDDSEDED
jgi:hypothetical protein